MILPTRRVVERRARCDACRSHRTTPSRARALNRRIEVEFWHDDPLQEMPDEPQLCPERRRQRSRDASLRSGLGPHRAAGAGRRPRRHSRRATREQLRRAMTDIADKTNVRLRFIGYTKNERLDRRTASVYGDDIGLSAARARRAMETIASRCSSTASQAEHEGRGYVHSRRRRERRLHAGRDLAHRRAGRL